MLSASWRECKYWVCLEFEYGNRNFAKSQLTEESEETTNDKFQSIFDFLNHFLLFLSRHSDCCTAQTLDCMEWFNYTFKECEHLWSSNLIEKTSMPHREGILSIFSDPGVWYANAATMSMLCKLSLRRKFSLFDSLFAMRLLDSQKFLRQVDDDDEYIFQLQKVFQLVVLPSNSHGIIKLLLGSSSGWELYRFMWLSWTLFSLIHVLMKRRFNV